MKTIVTEEQAKLKLCPFINSSCAASDCMKWIFLNDDQLQSNALAVSDEFRRRLVAQHNADDGSGISPSFPSVNRRQSVYGYCGAGS